MRALERAVKIYQYTLGKYNVLTGEITDVTKHWYLRRQGVRVMNEYAKSIGKIVLAAEEIVRHYKMDEARYVELCEDFPANVVFHGLTPAEEETNENMEENSNDE